MHLRDRAPGIDARAGFFGGLLEGGGNLGPGVDQRGDCDASRAEFRDGAQAVVAGGEDHGVAARGDRRSG